MANSSWAACLVFLSAGAADGVPVPSFLQRLEPRNSCLLDKHSTNRLNFIYWCLSMLFPLGLSLPSLSFSWFNLLVMIYTVFKIWLFSLIKVLFRFFQNINILAMFLVCPIIFFSTWLYFPSTLWIDFFTSFIFLFVSSWSHLSFLWILNSLSSISTTSVSGVGNWGVVISRGPVLPWSSHLHFCVVIWVPADSTDQDILEESIFSTFKRRGKYTAVRATNPTYKKM